MNIPREARLSKLATTLEKYIFIPYIETCTLKNTDIRIPSDYFQFVNFKKNSRGCVFSKEAAV